MTELTCPNLVHKAAMAHEAHQAKPLIPPMPPLRPAPQELKTPEQRLLWVRQAQAAWEDAHVKNGYRR